jgi:hypothetical protein
VLDENGDAVGPWDPKLDPETLHRGLRAMMLHFPPFTDGATKRQELTT